MSVNMNHGSLCLMNCVLISLSLLMFISECCLLTETNPFKLHPGAKHDGL